nr:Tm184 [Starmerella bombicola]
MAILKHLKNYRKPMDQRLIVRILMMVPLFSLSAYLRLYCPWLWLASLVLFIRELYEAFVIYTFYTLLTNLLGGEREIIFNATGRRPVRFLVFKLDISDPETYLVVKRLVMQYVWVRPVVSVLMHICAETKILKALIVIFYNVSVTLALNALMAFWVCLKADLNPYRVVLKFLSVKLIVFFSYWQTLSLSLVSSLGWISNDSLKLWGNSLICWESVGFAIVHWYAFPASDYDATFMFGFARLRIDAAFRDAFGIADLVHDFRMTFIDSRYGHRNFDSVEAVLDHPDSRTRQKRLAAGLRYRNGGRSKYWLPSSSLKLLLQSHPYNPEATYGSTGSEDGSLAANYHPHDSIDTSQRTLNMEDEFSESEDALYDSARKIYGDYNYPVATVRESEDYISFQERLHRQQILRSI